MPPLRVFLASFLVLFLEVALIRWLPAEIRLLAYFSNLVLLASFLGIGLGCLLSRARADLFHFVPLLLALLLWAAATLRVEIAVPSATEIYFSSGTDESRLAVEPMAFLPLLFVAIAALFVGLAQRMGREMDRLPPLRAYAWNLAGSLAGVGAFALASWTELPPPVWFAAAALLSLPFLFERGRLLGFANAAILGAALFPVARLSVGTLWSPYYKIEVREEGPETVLEVNGIFHQSMAPLERKEYFYEWPYAVFGDSFEDVLVLGAGTGTDVSAALKHGARRVDAVEIDPAILRLGAARQPDRAYRDPRVESICDDARHFLRTSERRYDLIVFALVDSLTVQSSFSGVRLESYLFTEEAFRAVRERLKPGGLFVLYNYFREPWLVDRLANLAAAAFGEEPYLHTHARSAWLAVLMAGPRVATLAAPPPIPDRVLAYGHASEPSPGTLRRRDASIAPTSDDWPFLYMKERRIPPHYLGVLAFVLVVSAASVLGALRGTPGRWSWTCFFLGAGFLLLETRGIVQFALLWGSTWVVASAVIASILAVALAATFVASRVEIRRPWIVTLVLLGLLGLNALFPVGSVVFQSRAAESLVYAALAFSPLFCAGLLFGLAIRRSENLARDYGANLLGAMVGGVLEYLSLITGHGFLLLVIAACYAAAHLSTRIPRLLVPDLPLASREIPLDSAP